MGLNMSEILKELAKKRKFFVSEADFQLALAWKLKKHKDIKEVLLEYPIKGTIKNDPNKVIHLDILAIDTDGKWIPIELKYKTKGCELTLKDGTPVTLANQSAQDIGRYLFLRDIQRIEAIRGKDGCPFAEGYAILITNDHSYKKKKTETKDREFSLHPHELPAGKLKWQQGSVTGEDKDPVELEDTYKIEWGEYSTQGDQTFDVLIVKTEPKTAQ